MIRDGKLAYGATPSSLRDFEFDNTVLNTFVIAILTTILSYQAASLAFDLVFGFKAGNKARISDMRILLLTRQSLMSLFVSLVRSTFRGLNRLTRRQSKRGPLRASVVGKLLLLLALVPFLNIVSIVLNFAREQTITFGEAEFGGTSLGINEDLSSIEMEPLTRDCNTAMIESARIDRPNVTFMLCQSFPQGFRSQNESLEGGAQVVLQRQLLTTAILEVSVGRYVGFSQTFADVLINESRPFHLRSTISPTSAEKLVNFGINILVQKCRSERPSIFLVPNESISEEPGSDLRVGKFILCPSFVEDEVRLRDQLLSQLLNLVTLVDADVLELIHPEDLDTPPGEIFNLSKLELEVFRADDYPFLIRYEPYVSVPMLAIITAMVFVVRMILKLFLNNDVAEGVHRLVKKALGFLCWQSLLRTGDVERYYKNYDHTVANVSNNC